MKENAPIIIVSGLPRSGTSMVMKMLQAGGLDILTDHIRTADQDNPKGYYEFERAKKLPTGDFSWLADARGKVVKVISALLTYLPAQYPYQVIFVQRALPEILASQRQMLINRGKEPDKVSDVEMIRIYQKHLADITKWLSAKENFATLYISYNHLLDSPEPNVSQMNEFLGGGLNVPAMREVIDLSLYRQRK